MTRKEAQEILLAVRPGDTSTAQAEVAEAIELASRDPQLQAWWKEQQSFDRAVSCAKKSWPRAPSSHFAPGSNSRGGLPSRRPSRSFAPSAPRR